MPFTTLSKRRGVPGIRSASWTAFFELAEALDAPLNFHIASGGTGLFTEAPWRTHGSERQMAVGGALLYLDNARMLTNLLYSDVLENHPKLKFVSVESGVGWIPFLLWGLCNLSGRAGVEKYYTWSGFVRRYLATLIRLGRAHANTSCAAISTAC